MKKFLKKTTSRKGETLVELLVSILLIALSVALLLGMYQASGRINQTAREMDEKLNQSVTEAGNRTGESQKGTVTFEFDEGVPDENGEIEVEIYSNESVTAYSKSPSPSEP